MSEWLTEMVRQTDSAIDFECKATRGIKDAMIDGMVDLEIDSLSELQVFFQPCPFRFGSGTSRQ